MTDQPAGEGRHPEQGLAAEAPYLAIGVAVLAWGFGPLLVRAISASPVTIGCYRLWLAVGRRELLLGGASLVGIAMVVLGAAGGGGATPIGDFYAVLNLLAFTAYFLVIKRRRGAGVGAAAVLAGVMLCAAIAVTPVTLLSSHDLGAIGGRDWLWLFALVLIPGTLGHGLMNWAQRYVDVTISSLMTLANPVVSTVGAWLVYDQVLNGVQILGAAVVLAALAGIVVAQRRPDDIVAEPP